MQTGGPAPVWEGHGSRLGHSVAGFRARVSKALGEELHAAPARSTVPGIPHPHWLLDFGIPSYPPPKSLPFFCYVLSLKTC